MFYDRRLYPAPADPHRCFYCGEWIEPGEWARHGKLWVSADEIKVWWFHAGCPVRFSAYNPMQVSNS